MRGRLAILLLALYTCSIIHLDELLKLPKLLAHFQTHHCTDPSMSFTDFLGLHYTMCQFQQNDYEQDMKLPFKVPQNCMNNFSWITLIQAQQYSPMLCGIRQRVSQSDYFSIWYNFIEFFQLQIVRWKNV